MPVFMFWNIARKDLSAEIGEACREHGVDVLILAECHLSTKDVLIGLNGRGSPSFYEEVAAPVEGRLRFFSRLPRECFRPVEDDGRVSVRALQPPLGREIIVVAAHLKSKLHADALDQSHGARQVREIIARAEASVGHKNTIVIGDLNMNPFEPGMTSVDGFHGLMDKEIVGNGGRVVDGRQYDFFYNPMWSRLGDESGGPPGTYFLNKGGLVNHFWETFDQVLLRPDLLPFYRPEALRVLDSIAGKPLIRNGRVDKDYSDHLPILINLETERDLP